MDSQVSIQEWNQYPGLLDDVGLGTLSFQDNVIDNPTVPTRAGLYVYLNSMLQIRPAFEDSAVIDFLNSRYKSDLSGLVSDLILASFDALSNAMYRNEPLRSVNLLRSFLVNKLPVFLQNNYAAMMFEPLTVEHCIRQALSRLDPTAFPSGSQMFDPLGRNSLLSEARQEFLFACALHQLIPERSIEEILEDVPMQSLPAGGRYLKDDLVQQCTSNTAKFEEYISEMENMEGNAGEIAAAITEILHTLCANNDTMTLKTVCNCLCRKIPALDVILLFTRPNILLKPLCDTLDDWQDHEDQGEYQPVYDEFGSILLFIVVVQHRFALQPDEVGIDSPDSFLLKYFRQGCASQPLDDLTEHESQLLGNWIKGLFEGEGISDEVMSACKPKEFHLLVATLFEQSLKACHANVLALDTLRNGFELLLEPFLLPSLIAAFTWYSHTLWSITEESTNTDTLLPAFQTLLKPPRDSLAIHNAVLSVTAKPLSDALAHVQRLHPSRPDINPILTTLNPYTQDPRHSTTTALNELTTWSTTSGGGLLPALRNTIHSLLLWNASSPDTSSSPSYTHRQLHTTIRLLGAHAVLTLLIDEATTSEPALDIITILIYTASLSPLQFPFIKHQISLRDALHSQSQSINITPDPSHPDSTRTTSLIRLHRRVEALFLTSASKTSAGIGVIGTGVDVIGDPNGGFMSTNAEGIPSTNIDDVLGEAEERIAASAQGLFAGENASLLGLI